MVPRNIFTRILFESFALLERLTDSLTYVVKEIERIYTRHLKNNDQHGKKPARVRLNNDHIYFNQIFFFIPLSVNFTKM